MSVDKISHPVKKITIWQISVINSNKGICPICICVLFDYLLFMWPSLTHSIRLSCEPFNVDPKHIKSGMMWWSWGHLFKGSWSWMVKKGPTILGAFGNIHEGEPNGTHLRYPPNLNVPVSNFILIRVVPAVWFHPLKFCLQFFFFSLPSLPSSS